MKYTFAAVMWMVWPVLASAASLKCEVSGHLPGTRHSALLADMLYGECKSPRGESYYAYMHTAGAAAHLSDRAEFTIACPGIRWANLPGKYYGVKAVAGNSQKVGLSLAANQQGVCLLILTDRGVGFGLTIGRLHISKQAIYHYY